MNRNEILEKVIELFSTYTDEEITEESELMLDLDVSSMEVMSLICNIEAEFDISIPESSLREMTTVSDVVDIIADLQA